MNFFVVILGLLATVQSQACTAPETRAEWRELSTAQRTAYLKAVRCLRQKPSKLKQGGARSRYEDFVWVHQAEGGNIHMTV